MITHHCETEDNILNGYFTDDYGKLLYSYYYDPESKILNVKCGNVGRKHNLSDHDIDRLSDDELKGRLIDLAQEIGEDLRANPPIQS